MMLIIVTRKPRKITTFKEVLNNLIYYDTGCFQKPSFREAVYYQEMFLIFPIFLCLAVE